PNSLGIPGERNDSKIEIDKNYADATPDYLALQTPYGFVPQQYNHLYVQDKFGSPIYYPFYDHSDGSWRRWAPLYWNHALTNDNGVVSFYVPGDAIKNFVAYVQNFLKQDTMDLRKIKLYVRVLYLNRFQWASMWIPRHVDGRRLALFDRQWNFEEPKLNWPNFTSHSDAYCDHAHGSSYAEGILTLEPEDIMILSGNHEIVPVNDKFYLSMMLMEADPSPSNNMTLVPEGWPNDAPAWFSDLTSYPQEVTIEIWNQANNQPIIQSNGLRGISDAFGVVTIEVSPQTVGPENINKLWPGFYTVRAWSNGTIYQKPAYTEFELFLKAQNIFDLSEPPIQHDLISMFWDEGVAMRGNPLDDNIVLSAWESNAPVLEGQIIARKYGTFTCGNYSANPDLDPGYDGIEASIYINGFKCYTMHFGITNSSHGRIVRNFSIPILWWETSPIDVSIEIDSLNNCTNKEVLISKLVITDSPAADRPDKNTWDVLSEIPTPLVNGIDGTWNNNADNDTGQYRIELDNGTIINATSVDVTVSPSNLALESIWGYKSVRKDYFLQPNYKTISAIVIIQEDCMKEDTKSTTINFWGLLPAAPRLKLDNQHYPQINPNETMYFGWQFPRMPIHEGIRAAELRLGNDTWDTIAMRPNNTMPTTLYLDSVYIPYRATMDLDVALPPLPPGHGANVSVNLKSMQGDDTIITWSGTINTNLNGTIKNFTIPASVLAPLEGKSVELWISTTWAQWTPLNASVHLLRAWMQGNTTLVTVSTGMPEPLRARVFSTTFLYFYAMNATQTLGVTVLGTPDPGSPNDFRLEISGEAARWLNIRDYSIPFNQLAFQWDDWTAIKALFREGSGGCDSTMYELDPATNDTMLAWLKFEEDMKLAVSQPKAITGFLKVYDNTMQGSFELSHLKRKLLIYMMPFLWNRTQKFYRLGHGARIETNLAGKNIILNPNPNDDLSDAITIAYRRPPTSLDLV
ncbi:MAG: hypothetical protein ACXQS8_02480, partial [Candidatus Helarchaeales archaeon]